MIRFITLDDEQRVISIRHGSEAVGNEIPSEEGELGQIRQPDGTFLTPEEEAIEQQLTIEEQIYAESLYQTALLELQMLGGV